MKKRKLTLMCTLILSLLMTTMSTLAFAGLTDIDGHWAEHTINKFLKKKYVDGYTDGSFKPDNQVTRAEFVKMVNKVMDFTKEGNISKYTDVPSDAWYYKDVKIAVGENYLKGTSESTISPENKITREEAITIIARIYDVSDDYDLKKYKDYKDISDYAFKHMVGMIKLGLVKGYEDGTLLPKRNLSRAESVVLLHRIIEKLGKPGKPTPAKPGKPVPEKPGKPTPAKPGKPVPEKPGKPAPEKPINKDALNKAIEKGTNIQEEIKFINADQNLKDDLLNAIEKGKAIKNSDDASQKEVDDATKAINDAINKLNGKSKLIADGYEPKGLDPKVLVNDTNSLTDKEKEDIISKLKETNKDLPPGTTITIDNTGKATFTYSDKSTDEILPENIIEQRADIVREENTKIVDLYWAQYVSIDFIEPPEDNEDITGSYKVEIDGVDITKDLRPVSDDSSLVKWELTSLNPKELVATRLSDGKTETVKLSDNQKPTAPELRGNMSVKYFLSKGPISYFEYHQSNYDENGNLRIKPRKTTFGHKKEDTSIPKHYVKKAEMDADGNGEIIVLFESEDQEHKDWIANIKAPIKLLSSDGTNNVIVDSVPFTVEKNVANGDYTVGKLSITTGGTDFRSTGEYILQIKSNEKTKYVPVHIVRDEAPIMTLKTISSINSGDNIWFDVKNMLISPGKQINRVTLKDPSGAVKEISSDQYSFFGNSFVLYNDVKNKQEQVINNIPYNGEYTIKVESIGYKAMEATFVVEGGIKPPTSEANTLDAVSRATGSSSSGGSSGGSGSLMTQGTILFNGDLLINALIIQKLELEYPHAKEIAERFDIKISGLEATNVMDNSKNPKYDIYDFSKAVQDAKAKGKYLSFEEYKKNGKIDPNTPYSFKEVLEDNLLGEVRYFNKEEGLESPNFKLVNKEDTEINSVPEKQEIRIKSSDLLFLEKLEAIYINKSSSALDKAKYSVNGDIITINADAFKIGNNTVVLRAPGYQNGYIPVEVKKDIKEVVLTPLKANEDVETTEYKQGEAARIRVLGPNKAVADGDPTNGDFLANIKSVKLKKPNGETIDLHTASVGGTSQDDFYGATGSTLTIRPGALKELGEYTVIIDTEYYGAKQTSFTIIKAPVTPPGPQDIKDPNKPVKIELSGVFSGLKIIWGANGNGDDAKPYVEKINSVVFNEVELKEVNSTWNESQAFLKRIGADLHIEISKDMKFKSGENTIILKAEGYKDLTLKIDDKGNIISKETPTPIPEEKDPNKPVKIESTGFLSGIKIIWGTNGSGDDAKPYVEKINNVVFNGVNLKEVKSTWNESQAFLKRIGADLQIEISEDMKFKSGENTITLKAEGYKNLTLKIDDKGNIIP